MNILDAARQNKSAWLAGGLFGAVLAAFLFLHATQPIFDPDIWWHLKTGEMMVQQKELLHTEPFTFHAEGETSSRESLILKGYWLWEVVAYNLYALLGFNGIFLLNLLTIGAIGAALTYRMYRNKISLGLAAPLLTLAFVLTRSYYPLERPQAVSFLFATLLMGILLQARQGGRLGWTLPALMCLWANMHGGFVVGDIILCCFAAGVVLQYRNDLPRMKHLLVWTLAGIGASLLNPNGALAFIEVFNFLGKPLQTGIIEYKSTWAEFNEGTKLIAILWLLIFLYGLGVVMLRRIYWPELFTALFLAYFSIKYLRNIGFFSLAMLPAIGLAWQKASQSRRWHFPSAFRIIAIGIPLFLLLWVVGNQWKQRNFDVKVVPVYPEAGVDFLQKSGLQGRMFNSYEYGGYLLWRLAPDIKIFIDGRGVSEDVFNDYKKISLTSLVKLNGRNEYEELLGRYQIDYIIQPIYDGFGNVQPLMKVLLPKEDWVPIYLDTQVYILARETGQNSDRIKSFNINKDEFKNRLMLIYSYLHRMNPQEIGFRVAQADMLIFLGRYQEAKTEIDAIAAISPNEKMLPHLRQELNLLAGRLNR